jgi:flagella basal body P-ring formation protein FlgA
VSLVARTATLNVTLSAAEVLQAGSEGDMIRVRNTASGKIVVGRVVSADVVEIPL